ncbi:hypothetical protein GGR53DRAFT_107892 [Hypoxylon sp. FL1150]|nr:hypothetical protein GGR53DRAFT_107892 [Hypoxylon sp. FL1150]
MASPSIRYRPPISYPLADLNDQVLEARRRTYLQKRNIRVIHPDYPIDAGPLLTFPPYDNDGINNGADYDFVIHACYLLVQNSWPRQDVDTHETPYLSYFAEANSDPITSTVIVRDCYLHVPGQTNYAITPSFDHWKFPHAMPGPTTNPHGTPYPNMDEQPPADLPMG